MFVVLENGQVMKKETDRGNEILTHFGMETQVIFLDIDQYKKLARWQKFNLDTGQYEDDTENTAPINYKGVEYIPINGQVEVFEPKEELLQNLKTEYLKLISEADMLGDTEEKTRLQQEYATRKVEIENMTV